MEHYFLQPWEIEAHQELFYQCMKIREEVFIQEQSVPFEIEQDRLDTMCKHILFKHGKIPIATMRIRGTDEGIKFERIAVRKEFRGLGIGKLMIREAIKVTRTEYADERIYLHAQQYASSFYESLHFCRTQEKTIEAGIEHVTMFLTNKI